MPATQHWTLGLRRLAGWGVWLVAGDRVPGFIREGGKVARAAGADVVVVEVFVVAGAELDEIVELGLAATLDR
jgi:hypothetical protein